MADRWDSSLYDDRHSWVWKKVEDLIDLLGPQPHERILDLGCGTGHLTAKIAERGAEVAGLDGSASMIAQARQNYPKLKFSLADARAFQCDKPFDAVFSNATLHWIPEARSVIARVAACLKHRGRFILEMGGKGNIARIVAALTAAIEGAGYPARNPWYFPSAAEYASLLEEQNFEIETLWTIERWNKLEHPEKGLRELLEMFAGHWFEVVPPNEREAIIGNIESILRAELWREGAWWADYRRLRIIARLRS
jgi:trans-aconitate 2-methyltransferase